MDRWKAPATAHSSVHSALQAGRQSRADHTPGTVLGTRNAKMGDMELELSELLQYTRCGTK